MNKLISSYLRGLVIMLLIPLGALGLVSVVFGPLFIAAGEQNDMYLLLYLLYAPFILGGTL